MIVAIPVWNRRVSPVFDVAKKVLVAEIDFESGGLVAPGVHVLNPARPASTLTDLGVDLLVCSAISSVLEAKLWAQGVEVVSDICGSLDEIMAALAAGDADLTRFRSPGSRCKPKSSVAKRIARGEGGPGRSV